MYSTADRTSASDAAEPPLGGMAFLPLMALAVSMSRPVLMRGSQAALSPNLGEPATPAAWQATQTCLYKASPAPEPAPAAATLAGTAGAAVLAATTAAGGVAAAAAAGAEAAAAGRELLASPIATLPIFWMRCATACSVSSVPAEGLLPEVTYRTSPIMAKIGTTKEKKTAASSCFGVLIGPVWASSWAVVGSFALMASSKKLKIGGVIAGCYSVFAAASDYSRGPCKTWNSSVAPRRSGKTKARQRFTLRLAVRGPAAQ